jgi:hypothetical protein
MSHYSKLIAAQTGADETTAALVEELMRSDRTALDGLSVPEFTAAAHRALREAIEMAAAGMLRGWCKAMGLAAPGWA